MEKGGASLTVVCWDIFTHDLLYLCFPFCAMGSKGEGTLVWGHSGVARWAGSAQV